MPQEIKSETPENNLQKHLSELLQSLLRSEKMPVEELDKLRFRQLAKLADYAGKHSPWFAERLKKAGMVGNDISNMEALRRLPVMDRRELQENATQIFCRQIPASHAPAGKVKTSGSSGIPVEIYRTSISQLYWLANGLREHLWHRRDFMGKLAVIRANLKDNKPVEANSWGEPVSILYRTGPGCGMPINRNVSEQAEWLKKQEPDYLLVYPNNLSALLDEFAACGVKLHKLKQIRTLGETMPESLRQRVKEELNVDVADCYSSQELGNIAMQCPEGGQYHIMAENLIVEVLDENGNQCGEGQTGRVVVTDFSNYATPLFRYDIGDYAVVGAACSCGRKLPTLKSIKGRERNMVVINGKKSWPLVGFQQYRNIAPIIQYQIIQKTPDDLEVKFAVEEELSRAQEDQLAKTIRTSLGYNFRIKFIYYKNKIPIPASGKFEEFICEVR